MSFCTDFPITEIRYVSQCDLILDQRFLYVETEITC